MLNLSKCTFISNSRTGFINAYFISRMKIIAVTTLYDVLCKDSAVTGATRMKLLMNSMLDRVAAYVIGKLQIQGSRIWYCI